MKPFKETKLGKFLQEKAPKVLDIVGDALPDKGLLGILKNLIDRDGDIPAADKLELNKLIIEFEKDIYAIEVQDRQSARNREVELAKAGQHDWLMQAVGIFILMAFAYYSYVTVYVTIPNESREIFIEMRSTVRDAIIAIIFYYWGSSRANHKPELKH